MNKILSSLATMLLLSSMMYGQSIDITRKVGKVSDEEVAMTSFDKDTSASVLVLWEREEIAVEMTNDGDLRRHCTHVERVKILKEDGKDWGDYSFRLYDAYHENMYNINVTTYNMDGGRVTATKMPKKSIYQTRENETTSLTFSAPEVRVGSVLEVSYETQSENYWDIGTYYFQRSVPVNCSELEVNTPKWLRFSRNTRGPLTLAFKEEDKSSVISVQGDRMILDTHLEHFTGTDIPAMKSEGHVYGISQYMSSVTYDLLALELPGSFKTYSNSWDDVDKAVLDSDIYTVLNSNCRFRAEVDDIMAQDLTPLDKVGRIMELTLSKVTWNKNRALVPGSVGEVLNAGTGDSADINAILGSALKHAGFKVDPVLIRTRSNGMVMDFHPSINSFNTFVLKVQGDGMDPVYLDGARKDAYFNILPADYLVKQGRIPGADGSGYWEDLSSISKANTETVSVRVTVGAEGTMDGNIRMQYTGIPSYSVKGTYHDTNDEEKFIDLFENDMSIQVKSITTENMDDYTKVCSIGIDFEKACDVAGDMIYVPAFIDKFHNKSDFKNPDRQYPVDFPCNELCNYAFYLEVADGYVIDQLPASQRLAFAPLGASVLLQTTRSSDTTATLQFRYKQDETFLGVEDYHDLQKFWEALCSTYESMIIIRKAD